MKSITTLEMEVELCKFLNHRKNIVIPNVSWGMFTHECDLIRLTPAGYCTEIEVKISLSDLKKDKEKQHKHMEKNGKIKYLYFAIPEYLENYKHHIPDRAGIIVVRERYNEYHGISYLVTKETRKPKMQSDYKFSEKERVRLLELMAMRIWGLKKKLSNVSKEKRNPTVAK